jgi:hypothetical protein
LQSVAATAVATPVMNITEAIEKSPEKINQSVDIFPNPAPGGNFSINIGGLENTGVFTLIIYDAQGKIVRERKIQSNSKINYNLSSGFYMIQLSGKKTTVSKKLVVQ